MMNDATITRVHARRIWDSRGRPTVEVEVHTAGGATGRAAAPAGASRGSREAVDLRDGGTRFGGMDVQRALANVAGPIAHALVGLDARRQENVDRAMLDADGTADKSNLGGNAMVAASLACAHAAAAAERAPLWRYLAGNASVRLPLPEIQIFGGGAHAGRRIDIQDLMVMPLSAQSFTHALEMAAEVYRAAGELMNESGKLAGVADEGGFWPQFQSNEAALETLLRAIERAGFVPGDEVAISLDIAASEFGRNGRYRLALDGRELDRDAMIELVINWIDRFPIVSLEDPVAEDDADAMAKLTGAIGDRVQVIGDDFLVTSAARVGEALERGACNAVLIKPNQAGTLTEARAALDAAKRAGWGTIVSARSGETEDTSIAELACGWDAGQLKVGSFARSERTAKWNEVLRIEEALGDEARFAGREALPQFRPGRASP
jgi:enolase 1/2/3